MHTFEKLLEQIAFSAEEKQRVSLNTVLNAVGQRSFGMVLLVSGLVLVAPLVGDIPGVTISVGALVFVVSVQMLFRGEHFWMPAWLLSQSISHETLKQALSWMRTPARYIDYVIRPRYVWLTQKAGAYAIAIACLFIALMTPAMELIPFSAMIAGAALVSFGLALIAHDGLVVSGAYIFTICIIGAVAYFLLF